MNSLITANILSNQVLAFMSNYQKNKMAITEESKTVIVNQNNAVDNQTDDTIQELLTGTNENPSCIEGVGCKIGGSFSQNNF